MTDLELSRRQKALRRPLLLLLVWLAALPLTNCASPPAPTKPGLPMPTPWQCVEILKEGGQC